ncbi:uncharacterized protein [Haliotis cracherodii]|uniref:uncharacterized protein n=1 Tax=Haliotis cracherodii TaxID=6455 RepID=UPI0039E8B59A
MVEYGVAIAWMVLSPVALLTCVAAVVVIAHYRPFFHGTDLCLMSLLACLMANVILLIPIPGVMTLRGIPWSQPLCYCYIWLSVTVRVAEILSVLCMCVHWMTMLRLPSGKQVYGSTKAVKVYVAIMWLLAALIGIMPIIGATEDGYSTKGTCFFLPHDLGVSFALFFIILILCSIVLCLICTSDTVVLLRYMRRVAVVKYQAGRFYLPSTSAVAKTGSQTVHARYNELTFSSDLCRLVLAVVIATAAINHIPFTLIEFGQLVEKPNRALVQMVVQWLLLVQSLTLPHAFWLISKRYRHALIYTWKVYVLRDSAAEEEDPSACTLQSYTRKVRDVDGQTVRVASRAPGRQTAVVTDRGNSNHVANGQALRANGNVIQGAVNHVHGDNRNGGMLEIRTTDLDDGMIIMTNHSAKHGGNHDVTSRQSDSGRNSMRESSPASPSKSLLSTPVRGDDLRRTASSSSRVEWKEQMRRKHLPAIFVNEAFDGDEVPCENKLASPKRGEPREKRKTGSDVSLYYMSSDYHHDSLTDNMPRIRHQESESEGASYTYGDDDIDNILDTQHTAVADTSMSMDMNDAFQEMLSGVTSDCVGLEELTKESTTDPEHHVSGHVDVDVVPVGVVEHCEEPGTPGSDHSITLEPYREERRPPWMDEDDLSPRSGESLNTAYPDASGNPNTVQFGTDIDKGFEEALALNYAAGYGPGGLGLCFESIREEPEETVSEGGAEADAVAGTVFKTQAVVSSGPSSRASSISDRPGLDDSRSDTIPLNGVSEPIAEECSEEELEQYEKNYKGPLTSFGRFYNNPTTENVNGLTPFRTFGYSEDGPPASPHYNANSVDHHVYNNNSDRDNHGNQEHLKPVEHIDHNDSFYSEHAPEQTGARKRFTFSEANGQTGPDDQTYYFDGKDGAWSSPDVPSPKPGIQSLGPWPENEDDLQDFDMSFDSDFSEVSTSNSQSDVSKPQVNGFVSSTVSSHAVNGETPETEQDAAFF